MNRQAQTPLLLAATLFLASGLGAAEEAKPTVATPPSAAPTMMKPARADELLKRFDANHDGKLDEDEVAAAHEAMLKEQMTRQAAAAKAAPDGGVAVRQRMLEQFDKNHDGKLDDEERAEMRKFGEERGLGPDGEVREELVKRFDKNADGKLDDAERAELEKSLQERRAQATLMRTRQLRQFDRNANGKLDADEQPAWEKATRERLTANPPQFARFDKDGDGKLDDAEWAVAREQLLALVNSPPPPGVEAERLARVAEEVAKRKAAREQAAQKDAAPKP